jgi:gas vesicle protein
MIRIKDHKQMPLFDPWHFLSPKRRRMLDESWPGLFREHLLTELPVDKIRPFLRNDFGAPSKELYTLLGVLLFQQTMDLNDAQCVEQLSFNIQWHYALNITEDGDSAKYISEKTLWHWRQVISENGLDQLIFDKISTKLAEVFNVNNDEQRIDSVHIKSNMRRLGRIGIFAQTISKFLVNLKRHHRNLFDTIDEKLINRYGCKKALAAFSLVKPSESAKTLQQVSTDLFNLIEQFKDQDAICNMHTYKLMQRVLSEQCELQTDNGNKVMIKKPKHIPADSLQNPSDPDASYNGYKGQGYQVQVMESFTRTGQQEQKNETLNLITHVAVERACAHDSNALIPAIEACDKLGLKPKTILADTLYGFDKNHQAAAQSNVELIAPTAHGNKKDRKRDLTGFKFDSSGRVTRCGAGRRPEKVSYKKKTKRYSAWFNLDHCSNCPHLDHCPVQPGKKNYFLRYSDKDHRLAVRRQYESSDEFIDTYRWRAGVEATMSQYDALTGVKRLRVRGYKAVRYCATLKAAGLNILRATAVAMARKRSKHQAKDQKKRFFIPFPFVKERICRILSGLEKILLPPIACDDFYSKSAA